LLSDNVRSLLIRFWEWSRNSGHELEFVNDGVSKSTVLAGEMTASMEESFDNHDLKFKP